MTGPETHQPWQIAGKTVLVTGATSGIGLEASVALARQGARVVLVGRDPARAEAALSEVARRSGSRDASTLLCDFSSLASVRSLAESVRARCDRLHVLVNNAGGVNKTRRLTTDGFETTFGVNHLAPFLLTNLLLDRIVESAPARIVTVASIGHRRGSLDFEDLGFERGYSIMRAYARSKLANVLFAAELSRRLEGSGVTSNSIHPGSVATRIWSGAPIWAKPLIQLLYRPFMISAGKGAAHVVELVVRPDLSSVSGRYFEERAMVDPAPAARDREAAGKLWRASAALVGLPSA
jgi:NAD(P)-dependent dehydrogenase (short-subunit alcohol dehydrogenase family)